MINPDLPIRKTIEDKLNRSTFAESLAKVMLDYSAPYSFSIGLYGKWGSGKTSLLNMVLETVEANNKDTVILRFNPWLCSDPNQLIAQFFKQMATAIKLKKPAGDRVWELIDQYGDVFEATALIPLAGQAAAALGKAVTSSAKRRVTQKTADLQGTKNKIVEKLTSNNMKMIVAIDDIDRLSEEEIIAVFQVVKALADFPNTIYLLAFDYDVVIRALSKVQHGDGKEYLEKVIQVPFEIPAPNMQSIEDTLFSKLNEILDDIPEEMWDNYTWADLYQQGIREYISSIRDVIRYVNVFYLKYSLLKGETNPVDLLGLTCLQVFEPFVYAKLPNCKKTFCGGTVFSFESQKEEREKITQTINDLFLEKNTITNETAVKQILSILFPKVNDAIGRSFFSGRNYTHDTFLLSNNIAELACFDRYFSLMLEDDAISTAMIKHIIFDVSEEQFKEASEALYRQGKIIRFLEEITAYAKNKDVNAINSERAKLIIKCLAQQWHLFEVEEVGFLTIPFQWRFLFCADYLLNRIATGDRRDFVLSLFKDKTVQPSTLSLLLEDFETSHGRFTEKSAKTDTQIFSLEDVLKLEGIFKNRVIEELDSKKALDEYNGLNFFWMLGNIDKDLASMKKKELVTDTHSLVKVVRYCLSRGVASIGRGSHNIWNLQKATLAEFVDPQAAYNQMKAFVNTTDFLTLSKSDQISVVAFCLLMEKKDSELQDNCVLEESINRELRDILERLAQKMDSGSENSMN